MRRRDAKVGIHVEHTPSGTYLGTVTAVKGIVLRVSGPHKIATIYEVRKCAAPVSSSRDDGGTPSVPSTGTGRGNG